MDMRERTAAILLIAVVALGTMSGVAAAEGHLEVAVDDTGDEPVVTVTENGTAVANATVNVSVVDAANESYVGAGDYQTDANGSVALPAPAEDVTVNVSVTAGNETASAENVLLEAPDGLALDVANTDGDPVVTVTDNGTAVENASVTVATAAGQNVTYAGEGDYTTDANGTVGIDAAAENVTVDVTASYENDSVSTTVDLTTGGAAEEAQPFGLRVQEFIESLQNREGGIGAAVSDFVTRNNPGNAPDHAGGPGGPDDANGNSAKNGSDARGNGNAPDHAGNSSKQGRPDKAGNDGKQGPPDHAGNGDDDADDDGVEDAETAEDGDAEDDDSEEDDAEDDNKKGGANRGNGNGNGNGN
jgi:hypothetical protein